LSHLATGLLRRFNQRDLHMSLRELQGRDQTGDTRAHHDNAMLM
jgi:hypothetical protein